MDHSEPPEVERRVAQYLDETDGRYSPGEDEYYIRAALGEALLASREGNYGIGAVVTITDGTTVREFRARNFMVTGAGVVDHAETRGLLAVVKKAPFTEYCLNMELQARPRMGLSVYGTLEPCPMCTCAMTNAGAARSVSGVLDGKLVRELGLVTTDGSANAIGKKSGLQPRVWRHIQDTLGLVFEVLSTRDLQLPALCWDIFAASRERVDNVIASRGPIYYR